MQPHEQLERELAAWITRTGLPCDPGQVVSCSSGTAALHLALEALGLPAGSGVLVPDYTMVACARAVTLAGLTPVFVDCDERLLMRPVLLGLENGGVGRDVGAVMPVHVYGRRVDMDVLIWDLGRYMDRWLPIVEDLAEAHGVPPHPKTDAACWSFYKNKIVAGEEGGAVMFKDPAHAALARELRCLGFGPLHDFRHRPRGHNYRLAPSLAERVLSSLRRWDTRMRTNGIPVDQYTPIQQRRLIEGWYDEECPVEWRMPPRDAPWVYDLRVPGLTRGEMWRVVCELNKEGVEARMGFCPMRFQQEYQNCRFVTDERPGDAGWLASGWAYDEVLYLPLAPGLVTRESVGRSFEVIRSLVGSVGRAG